MTLLPAVLAALAVGLLLGGPRDPGRLVRVLPPLPAPPPAGPPRPGPHRRAPTATVRRAVCGLAGTAVWGLAGGLPGLALGAAVVLAGPAALARVDAGPQDDGELARSLPVALELLAACLAGGAVPAAAVRAVAEAVPGSCGARFARVGAALGVGCTAAEAWRALGDDRGPAGAAARALARAAEGGAPVAAAVARVAEQARREEQARAERRARRAGVLAVLPLGLCFLPAFVLIGVVPAVLGLTGPLLSSL